MAKRKQSGIEAVAAMPWPMGIVLGLLGYVAFRYGIGWYLSTTGNPYLSGLGNLASAGTYAPLGWMVLVGCWVAAIGSFIGRARRRKLFDKQTGIDSLRQMSWRQFEQLTGEAFRRQGYSVEENGLGGADGGVDLFLRKAGQITLVQCKQWKSRQVGVKEVRAMYGLLVHHQAVAVKIVALGDYTSDARRFAHGKPIELIHGGELIATVRTLQEDNAPVTRPIDKPFALAGSMLAGLLLIAALSPSTDRKPSVQVAATINAQRAPQRKAAQHQATPRPAPSPNAVIYLSDAQNDAQLREWEKRNAESMKILEKTTKELPRR